MAEASRKRSSEREQKISPLRSMPGVRWCRYWLQWYARDRWLLKRLGWRKRPGGWRVPPDG